MTGVSCDGVSVLCECAWWGGVQAVLTIQTPVVRCDWSEL